MPQSCNLHSGGYLTLEWNTWRDEKPLWEIKNAILGNSRGGIRSGYELQSIKECTQPQTLFDFPAGYCHFVLYRLFVFRIGLGQRQ
jgi:hypothetical protein